MVAEKDAILHQRLVEFIHLFFDTPEQPQES